MLTRAFIRKVWLAKATPSAGAGVVVQGPTHRISSAIMFLPPLMSQSNGSRHCAGADYVRTRPIANQKPLLTHEVSTKIGRRRSGHPVWQSAGVGDPRPDRGGSVGARGGPLPADARR